MQGEDAIVIWPYNNLEATEAEEEGLQRLLHAGLYFPGP